jgi:carnitine 3-dehydrogenase
LKLPWTRLEAPELTKELRDNLVDGANRLAAGRDYATLNRQRDLGLIAISKALKG